MKQGGEGTVFWRDQTNISARSDQQAACGGMGDSSLSRTRVPCTDASEGRVIERNCLAGSHIAS